MEGILNTNDEWIYKRTGIKEGRIAAPDVNASDLAKEASLQAMEMARITAKGLDLIVMTTMTLDTACPAGSNWLEAKLGAQKAVSFDVTAACSGFIFGLSVAEQYLKAGTYKTALVVAVEIMSRTLDWTDRESCILWGNGAGAAVLRALDSSGKNPSLQYKGREVGEILSIHIHTDGANGENLLLPGGGSRTTPISDESVDRKLHTLRMIRANESVRVAVRRFAEAAEVAASFNHIHHGLRPRAAPRLLDGGTAAPPALVHDAEPVPPGLTAPPAGARPPGPASPDALRDLLAGFALAALAWRATCRSGASR